MTENVYNSMEIAKTFILLFCGLTCIGVFCEFGQMVAHTLVAHDDELKRCRWYLFPIEMQRAFRIVIVNSQQSTNMRGIMKRTREALKNVHPFRIYFNHCTHINIVSRLNHKFQALINSI